MGDVMSILKHAKAVYAKVGTGNIVIVNNDRCLSNDAHFYS
jgi:hypothetical protein